MLTVFMGCATAGNLAILDKDKREQVRIGTSKSQVQALIGSPTSVTFGAQGQETWSYQVAHSRLNPAVMIPVVGLFANNHDIEFTSMTLMFGDDGKVQKLAFTAPVYVEQPAEIKPNIR